VSNADRYAVQGIPTPEIWPGSLFGVNSARFRAKEYSERYPGTAIKVTAWYGNTPALMCVYKDGEIMISEENEGDAG
jgi:hypothetical protein